MDNEQEMFSQFRLDLDIHDDDHDVDISSASASSYQYSSSCPSSPFPGIRLTPTSRGMRMPEMTLTPSSHAPTSFSYSGSQSTSAINTAGRGFFTAGTGGLRELAVHPSLFVPHEHHHIPVMTGVRPRSTPAVPVFNLDEPVVMHSHGEHVFDQVHDDNYNDLTNEDHGR